MSRFVPAEELKKVYDVFGHFYSVQLDSGEIVHCRSVLELVDKSCTPGDLDELSPRQPDAVFVMMNPGSSRPLVEVHNHLRADELQKLSVSLVPTRPDTTQYQVMRVMRLCQWRHVRVLNLSDLRCSKSGEFIKQFTRLETIACFDAHSVFSEVRKRELSQKLPRARQTPVVYAWGLSEKLDPLIERCLARIPRQQSIRGVLEEGTTNKYRHPLPSLQKDQQVWLQRMVRHCLSFEQ